MEATALAHSACIIMLTLAHSACIIMLELCVLNLCGIPFDSHPIHYWMGCESSLNEVYTPSNDGWSVSRQSVLHKMSIKNISYNVIGLCSNVIMYLLKFSCL